MSEKNKMASQESINATTTAASNTASVVTVTAPAVGYTIFITGIILSANATITTAAAVTLTGVTGGTLTMQIPAAAIAPLVLLFGVHPLRITPSTNAVLTLPGLGVNVTGTATLLYYIGAS